jgi:hypothetical protein
MSKDREPCAVDDRNNVMVLNPNQIISTITTMIGANVQVP